MSDSENRYEPGKDEHGLFMGRTGDGRFVLYASYLDTKARAEKAEAERDRLREALEKLALRHITDSDAYTIRKALAGDD